MGYPVTRYRRAPAQSAGLGDIFDIVGGIAKAAGGLLGGGGGSKAAPAPMHTSYTIQKGIPYQSMTDNNGKTYWYWNGRTFNLPEDMTAAMNAAGATAQNPNGTGTVSAGGVTVSAPSSLTNALPWIAGGLALVLVAPRLLRLGRR